jgi:23S rRNA (guanosine2251-2'-O)-methyltransferase
LSNENNRSRVSKDDGEIVFGKNPIREILRAKSRKIFEIQLTSEVKKALEGEELGRLVSDAGIRVSLADTNQLNRLAAPGAHHQNIVARVAPYSYASLVDVLAGLSEKALILVLDCIQDPQNFATLCRTALAFGVDAVILPKDRSVMVTGTVCKASSGAVEHLKIAQVTNLARTLEELKEKGFWIYGTSLTGESVSLNEIDPAPKSAIVLGSEGDGLRSLVAKTCDVLVKIPMKADFDSLNVAQAGAICLYEFSRPT